MAHQLDMISPSGASHVFPSPSASYSLPALSKRGTQGLRHHYPHHPRTGNKGALLVSKSDAKQSQTEGSKRLNRLREVMTMMDSKHPRAKARRSKAPSSMDKLHEEDSFTIKRPQPYRPPLQPKLPELPSGKDVTSKFLARLNPKDELALNRNSTETDSQKHPSKRLIRMDTTVMASRWKLRARGKRKRGRRPRRKMAGFKQTDEDLNEEEEEEGIQKTFGKLRTAVKLVIYLLRLSKTYIVTENDAQMIKLFNELDAAETGEKYKIKGEELFDPVMFRANKQQRVSTVTKKVLAKDPEKRTDKDIYHVHVEFQQLKSITKYPLEMQRELIRNAWYEDYPAGRIILRFRRRPQAFYTIIAGSAVLLEGDPDKPGRGASAIGKGDIFGHEAIANGGRHNYTVISKDRIQLLCLGKEDYIRIFMAGGFSNVKSYENSFIQTISIFKGWPVHLLKDNVKQCRFNYFIGGTVMVEDSQKSNWIFIIKSGSCAVMKKVTVNKRIDEGRKRSRFKKALRSKRKKNLTDHEWIISQKLKEYNDKASLETKSKWHNTYFGPSRYINVPLRNNPFSESEEEPTEQEETKVNEDFVLPVEEMEVSKDVRDENDVTENKQNSNEIEEKSQSLKQFSSLTKGPYMKPRPLPQNAESFKKDFLAQQSQKNNLQSENEPMTSPEPSPPADEEESYQGKEVAGDDEEMEASDSDEKFVNRGTCNTETKLVLVDTIEKGAVFGVLDIAFGPQPSLTLVSNGAECIMVSKKLYLQHISEANIKTINDEMRPYANDETLQKDLEEKLTWGDDRTSTLTETARKFKKYRKLADDPRLPRAALLPKV